MKETTKTMSRKTCLKLLRLLRLKFLLDINLPMLEKPHKSKRNTKMRVQARK
jgi:hypothetical protein